MSEEHQAMYNIHLHDSVIIKNGLRVTRVVGGWIYENLQGWEDRVVQAVFVPEPLKKEG